MMRTTSLSRIAAVHVALVLPLVFFAWVQPGRIDAAPVGGLGMRQPNTTLRLPTAPADYPFWLENAFPGLNFSYPMTVVTPPGENNKLFVVEQPGRIILINNLDQPTRTVFLDLTDRADYGTPDQEGGTLGLAFHPNYANNGYFFVYYLCNTTTANGTGRHDRLSRFTRLRNDPTHADPSSEVVLFSQYDEKFNHNGGTVLFGPDGCLYITLGDEGHPDDMFNNAQKIDKDFFSGVMRLDVDHRPGSLSPNPHPALAGQINYWIPPDNPYVGATTFNGLPVDPTKVRTEFWAVGLRSPWRMYWDDPTGNLYVSDVGEIGRVTGYSEEINLIVKGGNYGWPYLEANGPGPKADQAPAGFQSLPPLLTYPRGNSGQYVGRAAIGGVVYRGAQASSLNGAYVFGDYFSGNIWALRHSGYDVTSWQFLLAQGQGHTVSFGTDPRNGDVLICDVIDGQVKRLVVAPANEVPPSTLADTGAFSDLATLTPNSGIIPYDVIAPFWSDGALKRRWFSIPNVHDKITFNPTQPWKFPPGTVWIKQFDLEMTKGDSSTARPVETRFLVRNATGVYGLTYAWDDAGANATLVDPAGLDRTFTVNDGGNVREQTWHYPARNECISCHTPLSGYALAFNTAQLNRGFNYPNGRAGQISALARAGYFRNPPVALGPSPMVNPSNPAAGLTKRVKSYLASNCSQCHRPGGSGRSFWDARLNTPLERAGIVNGGLADALGNPNNRVVAPRSPEHSVLLQRISTLDPQLRMPPLSSTVLDQDAIALVTGWINSLPARHIPLRVRVTFPNTTLVARQPMTIRGVAVGDNLSQVVYSVNGEAEQQANGVTAWSVDVTLNPGINRVTFYAVDGDGNRSRPVVRLFRYRPR